MSEQQHDATAVRLRYDPQPPPEEAAGALTLLTASYDKTGQRTLARVGERAVQLATSSRWRELLQPQIFFNGKKKRL